MQTPKKTNSSRIDVLKWRFFIVGLIRVLPTILFVMVFTIIWAWKHGWLDTFFRVIMGDAL